MAEDALAPMWLFFTVVLVLGYAQGGPLSSQALVSAMAFFFSLPLALVGTVSSSSAWFLTPFFIILVSVWLFGFYKQSVGVPFYAIGLGVMVVMALGV